MGDEIPWNEEIPFVEEAAPSLLPDVQLPAVEWDPEVLATGNRVLNADQNFRALHVREFGGLNKGE